MEILSLNVQKRTTRGKGAARRSRAAGRFPGVFYGPNQPEAIPLEVESKEFSRKLGSLEGSHLIQFASDGEELKGRMVLLREVQNHPVSGLALHADFYEVDLSKKLEVSVALHFIGKPMGVEKGGILQPIVREITVNVLPTEIPDFIPVDVSGLDIHDSIHVEDLTLPSGVEPVYESNFTIVTVQPPTVEEVKVEAAEGDVAAAAAPAAEGTAEAKPGEGKKGE
jgi:large subunit ribosomal protein L25